MRYFLVLFVTIFLNEGLTAQRGAVSKYIHPWAVRVSPLGLIDVFDGNLTAGVAYTLNNRLTLSADLSYIFYSEYIYNKKSVSGYILKPGIRYYLTDRRKFFVEALPFYKSVGYKIRDWLGRGVVNGVPSYQELTTFTFRKQVIGLNVMAGFQKSLMRNNLLLMEIYAGISVRRKWQGIKNNPGVSYQPELVFDPAFDNSVDNNDVFSNGFGVPHGLRLVHVIR